MKRNMSQASLDNYFGRVKDEIAPNQKAVIRMSMCFGVKYTRAEVGRLCGYSQTSAGRAIKELIADGIVKEVGRKECSVNGTNVGAVTLSLSEAFGNSSLTNTKCAGSAEGGFVLRQSEVAL